MGEVLNIDSVALLLHHCGYTSTAQPFFCLRALMRDTHPFFFFCFRVSACIQKELCDRSMFCQQ